MKIETAFEVPGSVLDLVGMSAEAAVVVQARAYIVARAVHDSMPGVEPGVESAFPRPDGGLWVVAPLFRDGKWWATVLIAILPANHWGWLRAGEA